MRLPKLRQMCGGGSWKRADLRRLRRVSEPSGKAWIWDFAGWALVRGDANWGPLWPIRFNGKLRGKLEDRASEWAYRAGWPDRVPGPVSPIGHFYTEVDGRVVHGWWLRLGPWVIGDLTAWDESGAP